jgi:uncharacterized membrane-anchored protein
MNSAYDDASHHPHAATRHSSHSHGRAHGYGHGASGSQLTRQTMLRVPQITALFWIIKGLSTAMGEATSDFLVNAMNPELAVALGFLAFALALALQFRTGRYKAVTYWFAVVMVGVFGTMAADVLHVGFGVPYTASTALYAVVLAAVFITWHRTEKTLSIHSVDSPRREAFYWATVVATFAMGTALGDFTATTLHLGFWSSAVLFAVLIMVPVLGYRLLHWNEIFAFWFAYVVTRPLGASIADGLSKPKSLGGLGYGDGTVAFVFGALIVVLVAYLAKTKSDVQAPERSPAVEAPMPAPTPTPTSAPREQWADAWSDGRAQVRSPQDGPHAW